MRVPLLTLLFTDVEGSTQLVERHGATGTEALIRHHAIIRAAAEAHGGRLFERIGDAAYAVFPDAAAAVEAAVAIHRQLETEDWGPIGSVRVRMALDTSELQEREGRYFGRGLHRSARIQSMARGGETLISDETARLVSEQLPPDYRLRDLGEQKLRGLASPVRVWGVVQAPAAERSPDDPAGTDKPPIRVLLVDDYEVVRRGLRGFLELLPEIEIVGEASNGREAVDAAYRLQPDVILMDLVMPEMDGIEAIRRITAQQPAARILVLTSFAADEKVFPAIKAGALGYLLKDSGPEELVHALHQVHRGESSLHPTIARRLLQELGRPAERPPTPDPLTEREVAVLRLVARGHSNREIADDLAISEATVRTHVSNILGKLHLASRTRAALYALREGLASLDDARPDPDNA